MTPASLEEQRRKKEELVRDLEKRQREYQVRTQVEVRESRGGIVD